MLSAAGAALAMLVATPALVPSATAAVRPSVCIAGGGIGTRPLDLSGSGGGNAVSPAVALTLNCRPRKPGPVAAGADGAS